MKTLQKCLLLVVAGITSIVSYGQEITQDLKSFNKIVASPRINLILQQGQQENIRLVYSDITPDKINIEVKGNTLRIYLDDARVVEKTTRIHPRSRASIYQGVSITAY